MTGRYFLEFQPAPITIDLEQFCASIVQISRAKNNVANQRHMLNSLEISVLPGNVKFRENQIETHREKTITLNWKIFHMVIWFVGKNLMSSSTFIFNGVIRALC